MYKIDSKVDKPDIEYLYKKMVDSMNRGIAVADLEKMHRMFLDAQQRKAAEIRDNYRIENPNSSQQIIAYLERVGDTDIYENCFINDKWTTNKVAFGNLALLGYKFAEDILSYRKSKKLAESAKTFLDSKLSDGKVHPTVSLGKTNRLNYSRPALMNIPKQLLWQMIRPRKPDNRLISVDIKNQEPGILINWLGIEELKSALTAPEGLYENLFSKPFKIVCPLNIMITEDKEFSGYEVKRPSEMAKHPYIPPVLYTPIKPSLEEVYYEDKKIKLIQPVNVLVKKGYQNVELPDTIAVEFESGHIGKIGIIWDKYNKSILDEKGVHTISGTLQGIKIKCSAIARKEFKTSWLAMTYGASIVGVRAACKHIDGDATYKYFSNIPQFSEYRKKCFRQSRALKQDISTYFGTVVTANETQPSRLQRVLMDLPIQGTGADILSLLVMHFDKEVKKRGIEDKIEIYYTRHDELILEADKDWIEELGLNAVTYLIKDILEHQVDDWEPFKIEVNDVTNEIVELTETEDELLEL